MNCRRVVHLLSNHLEGRLPVHTAGRVASHLAACPVCRRMRDDLVAAGAELRALPEPSAPPDVERRAVARWLGEQTSASRGGRLPLPSRPERRDGLGLLALAVACLLIAVGLVRWDRSRVPIGRTLAVATSPRTDRNVAISHPAPQPVTRDRETRAATRHAMPSRLLDEPRSSSVRPRARGTQVRPSTASNTVSVHRRPAAASRPWAARSWDGAPSPSVAERIEAGVRRSMHVQDDFVQIPFPRLVSASDRSLAAAVESYRREAAVVDTRLAQEVTVQQKATALSDLCAVLRADTGIQLTAGPSVADEKVTLLCRKMTLRDVMRQLSRPFGYIWLRSGRASSRGEGAERTGYRYELVQDLRSQLLEEELRNRDRNAALLALDGEVERYRKYLHLSPDEALAKARTASPEEKKLLEQLATTGWGAAQMYFRLSPDDMAGLRAGRALIYGRNLPPDPLGRPYFAGKRTADGMDLILRTLPPDIARGTLQGLRDWRVRDGRPVVGKDAENSGGVPPASSPDAQPAVILRLHQDEMGQYSLDASSGLALSPDAKRYLLYGGDAFAVGVSPAVARPENRLANAALAHDTALQPRVTVQPRASCGLAADGPLDRIWPNPGPRVTMADILEEIHRATGLSIVADYYTRLYPPADVSVRNVHLFDALNQVADATRTRWSKESSWLRFRSTGFYNNRLKEVPNRLLNRWAALRKHQGASMLDDLIEMSQLSDAQLDSREMGEGAWRCFGLEEWSLANHPRLRYHLRYLGTLSPSQRQAAQSAGGLPFARMSLEQQQGFLDLAVDKDDPQKLQLGDLGSATLRVVYMLPGEFQWVRPEARVLPPGESASPPVRERTQEAALAAARRLDPRADATQIVRTDLNLVFLYTVNEMTKREVAFR
jgi:hypothetical protein